MKVTIHNLTVNIGTGHSVIGAEPVKAALQPCDHECDDDAQVSAYCTVNAAELPPQLSAMLDNLLEQAENKSKRGKQ